jgi:hypothetical protein
MRRGLRDRRTGKGGPYIITHIYIYIHIYSCVYINKLQRLTRLWGWVECVEACGTDEQVRGAHRERGDHIKSLQVEDN